MPNNFFKQIAGLIRTEKRIFLVLVFLLVTFFINRELYSGNEITSKECLGGKCLSEAVESPQLTEKDAYYYAEDVFDGQLAGYYRLTFREKSDQAQKVLLKLSTYTEKESQIGELDFTASDKFQTHELFFFLPDGFSSLLFQKKDSQAGGNVFIQEIGVTKLKIDSDEELAGMQKTILGESVKADVVRASQSNSQYAFSWLKEKKTILGQIFRASDDLITAAEFDITVNKNLNPSTRQYALNLRKVNYDGKNISFTGPTIASLNFSVGAIEKYRKEDGTFLFPLYGRLEKGEYYAISLDNSKVGVSEQNYLEFRGTRDSASYRDGTAMVRKFNALYPLDGDLFFKVYGADFSDQAGARILSGAKIEDLGKGVGKYSYETKGKFSDLLDLETASPGTEFSGSAKVIVAPTKDDANFTYAVDMLYPITKFNFSASQIKPTWKKVKVSYSFDQKDWIDLGFSEQAESSYSVDFDQPEGSLAENETGSEDSGELETADDPAIDEENESADEKPLQVFEADVIPTKVVRKVYFRITYDSGDLGNSRYFGLKNLKITAELKMK